MDNSVKTVNGLLPIEKIRVRSTLRKSDNLILELNKAPHFLILLLFLLTFPLISLANSEVSKAQQIENLRQSFMEKPFGYSISKGAAAGYIDDKACGTCHYDMYQSYQSIGMSRSFLKPEPKNYVENFDAEPYFHKPSQRFYEVRRRGDDIYFVRYQVDEQGKKINHFERKIDWILGSGNKTRTYLYQTELGEIFQLPIGWYSETKHWALSPGYDKKFHDGVVRPIRRECMFCHNAFPEVAEGSDEYWQPHLFPKDLPHGTGCQRCHGPGGKHIQTVIKKGSSEEVINSIVNPRRLERHKRDSVCFQCHMLPSVKVVGMRRYGRGDYSFRPGEMITDYTFPLEVSNPDIAKKDSFEINHHAYRLTQSQCFTESKGELTCISCHNPHQKVPSSQRIAHYTPVCLKCHEKHDMQAISTTIQADDCTTCHMPKTRTQDVIHVVMTDHLIQKQSKSEAERMAPLEEKPPNISGIEFLMPEFSAQGVEGEIYKTVPLLRAVNNEDSLDYLKEQLAKAPNYEPLAYFDLAKGELMLKRYDDAEKTLTPLLKEFPDQYILKQWMGISLHARGKIEQAESYYQQALALNDKIPELYFNYGLLKLGQEKYQQAREMFSRSIELRPVMSRVWYYQGFTSLQLEQNQQAISEFRQALSIDPSNTRAYQKIAETYVQQGEKNQAVRYLKQGLKSSLQPQMVMKTANQLFEVKQREQTNPQQIQSGGAK